MRAAPSASRAGAILVMTGSALFGTVGAARVLGPDAPSAAVGAARLVVAAAIFVAMASAHGPQALWSAARLPSVWVAGVAQALFNLTFLAAVTRSGVAIGTLVAIGCTPILTGLLARHITRAWLIATSIALIGLVALLSDGLGHGVTVTGLLFALGASASYATFIMASTAMARSAAALTPKLAVVFVVAAICLSPALLLSRLDWLPTADGLAMVAYLSIAATVLAYSSFNRGVRTIAPGTVATLGLTEPLIAALLGVFLLDERLSLVSWLGAFVVLLGLVVMIRLSRPTPPELQTVLG